MSECLRNSALTTLGLIMAATPLALWVAWTQMVFVLVLAVGAAAGVLFCALYVNEKSTVLGQSEDSARGTGENLEDEFLSEVSNLGPFVYHHRRPGDPTFRRLMKGLLRKGAEP